MSHYITPENAVALLAKAVDRAGSQRQYAEAVGCEQSAVSRVLAGKENLTSAMQDDLGLQKVVAYRRTK